MDFENMKRKQLQALCKEHGIPANLTNLEMVNKLSSLLKVNDKKPLTRGRSCLKIMDENVNERESDVVNRKVKKVKFSPDNEIIEFTRSVGVKRRGRQKSVLYKSNLNVVGILDSPVRVTRSGRVSVQDGVTEKKGGKRHVKESVDEVGVTTRSLRNKEVVIVQEKREENEGRNDGLLTSRRVRSRKNGKESVADTQEELTIVRGGQMNESTKSETEVKETKRVTRRKSMAHNQTLHVQNEVDAEVKEEVVEKPGRVTRSRNLKPVEDNASNKRNRTRGKEDIETSEELLCTASSVEAVKDEVRVNTRRSRHNSVVEAPHEALKKSGRVANKAKGARLTVDIPEEKMATKGRTRNQSNLTVEASASESGTKIVEPKGKLEEPVEVPLRRSDRRKSLYPLENLIGDEVAAKKEKGNFLKSNDEEQGNEGTKEEPQKALKHSKRVATQVEDSVLAKDVIAENEVILQTVEVPVRSNRRKSVVPSLEKVRSDEVAVVKEKRNLNAIDDEIRGKGTKEEPKKASKQLKRLAKQMKDPVLVKGDVAENKLEERRCTRRNAVKANLDTKILDRSVQGETSVVKEERRCSGRSAARPTLAAISDHKKEKSENKLTKRNCTIIQEKDSTNKFSQQDLDSPKQSTSSSKASVKAAVVKKTSTVGKTLQGGLERSNVSFSRSSNEPEPVLDDVDIVLAGTRDDTTAESSTISNKLNEEEPLVDENASLSENNSTLNSPPFSDPFNSDAKSEENLVEELLKSDHKAHSSKGLCPSSVLADDTLPNDITSDRQEPGAVAAHNAEEFITGLSNDVLDNVGENLDIGTKDDAAAESSTLADKLIEEGPFVDANASPCENNSTSNPLSDSFNSDARPEENLVQEILQSDHEESASKSLCPSSVLGDDAVRNDIASDKQEPGAIEAANAEEFVTGLSNDVLDNCSLRQSDNMGDNIDSGTKDDAAVESSTLTDKLIEERPLVETNASPSENNSISNQSSDSFNPNARLEDNQVEDLLQFDHENLESKYVCPSSVLAEDAVPNEITSDKHEHGSIATGNAEGLSDEVPDNCSISQSDNMEENLDSGFKEQSETGFVVTEGVTYGEQESASKDLCLSFALADDAVPNDITSDKQEHGAVAADNTEEFDTGLSNEVLDNMEENLDAVLKEQSVSGCIVIEGATYGNQEPESKGLCPRSVLSDNAVPNDRAPDTVEHGAIVVDNGEEFDTGSSSEDLDNCSVNQSDNIEEKLDSGFKEQFETQCIVSDGVNYSEQELTVTDYEQEFDAGLSSNVSLDNAGAFNQSNEMELNNSESGPLEQTEDKSGPLEQTNAESGPLEQAEAESDPMERAEAESDSTERVEAESDPMERAEAESDSMGQAEAESDPMERTEAELDSMERAEAESDPVEECDLDAPTCTSQGDKNAEEYANLEAAASEKTVSSPIKAVLDLQVAEPGFLGDGIASHVTPSEDCDEEKQAGEDLNCEGQGEYLKSLFATPFYSRSSKVERTTCIGMNETSSQYQHSFHENESMGEELKGLFATPSAVSQSVGDHHYLFQSQLSGEAITTKERLGSSGTENLSESVRGLIEDKQVEHLRTSYDSPVSVKCTSQETTSTKGKYSQSHEMETYVCSAVERNQGESEAGSVGVDQAHECSHITAFNYGDENEQEDQPKLLGNMLSAALAKSRAPVWSDEFSSQEPSIKETAGYMKVSCALEEENYEDCGNMPSATSAKSMTPLWSGEFSSQGPMIKETAECTIESSALEEENDEGQCSMLAGMSAKNMTPLREDEFPSQEPKTTDVAISGEMVRDTEMNKRHESCVQEIVGIEEHKIEETVADRDLLLRGDTSGGQEEDINVGIAKESTSPVISEPTCNDFGFSEQKMAPEINKSNPNKSTSFISEPTCDDIGFSDQQMVSEINKSNLKNVNTSDAFNEVTEDDLKLMFATPIKGTIPFRLGEASSCQLKTTMIAMASEMAGKQGFPSSGEPLTVDIISRGYDRTKRSCFSKEIEQFEGGPLFPTPSKGISPVQLEESLVCEEDIFKDLDGVKFAHHEDQQLLNEMTDDTGEATFHWSQTNDDCVPRQTEVESQKENNSAHSFEPLHEKGEVTEVDALAEGKEDDHLVAYQESLEARLINTDKEAEGSAVSDAVCQQSNILSIDISTENITKESTRKTNDISVSAESGILELDGESTALRSQEMIIISVEETKGDEVQKLEVRSTSNAFSHSIPNDDGYAKEISTVMPANEQFRFPEHYVVENVSSTEELTASTNECQHVSKEDDLATESDRPVIFESNESTPMNVHDSGLTTQMDQSALSEEPWRENDQGKSIAAKQQDEDSSDKKEYESTIPMSSPSYKSHEIISFIEEGFADEDTLMSQKKNELAAKKVPLTPAGVAKPSFAKQLNSTVKKKNARSILIHGTPNKLTQIADMKENAPTVKRDIGTLTALRPQKRPALKDLPWK